MEFFGIGITEFFVIAMIALLFIKPSELPAIIRSVVKQVQNFRVMSFNVKREILDIYEREIEPEINEFKDNIKGEIEPYKSKVLEDYHDASEEIDEVSRNIDISKPNETEDSKP
ncbi:MAG: hypothetical protein COA79_12985 [Planctomycetota bacterium]|nr:MAG: hypothetical protein COA79_12985 [Planctomycetota bacterium]